MADPTREEMLQEAYRRGLLKGKMRAAYEGAVTRGLTGDAQTKALVDARTQRPDTQAGIGGSSLFNSLTMGFGGELVGAARAASTGIQKLTGHDPGYSMGDAYGAGEKAFDENVSGFRQRHPAMSFAGDLASGLATAPFGGEVLAGARGLGLVGRSVGLGAALGGVHGVGSTDEGSFADRLVGGAKGAAIGGAVGAAAPVVGAVAGAATNGIMRGAQSVATSVARSANRAAGGTLLPAGDQALQQLAQAMHSENVDPNVIQQTIQQWNATGAPPPSFAAVLQRVGAEKSLGLIRGAAMTGPARGIAAQNVNRITADTQDRAIDMTRQLTPYETRPAATVQAEMEAGRAATGARDYGAVAGTVPLSEETLGVLRDGPGQTAIRSARADAIERQDTGRVAELDSLLSENPPTSISAATLDKVQRAFGERGAKLARAGNNTRASGAYGRQGAINDTLDNTPELAVARQNQRNNFSQQSAIDVGRTGIASPPDDYAAALAASGDGTNLATHGAGIGYRQVLTDTIGAPAEGAQGVLNKIASNTNQGRNLAATYGQEAAGNYRQGIRNLVDEVNTARSIDPNKNSRTAMNLMDVSMVEAPKIPHTITGAVVAVVNKLRAGAALTEGERALLVQAGVNPASDSMSQLTPYLQQLQQGAPPTLLASAQTGAAYGAALSQIPTSLAANGPR